MEKGYVHVYTGNGKGKTTAAFGLALRAAMAGKRVYIGQFVKDMKYSETQITELLEGITVEQLGRGCFIVDPPEEEDRSYAKMALEKCAEILSSGSYDVVILDEINIAFHYALIDVENAIEVIQARKPNVEVVLTGRYAPERLIEVADLVTEMREVKHYYKQGVLSRKGIDC